MTSRIDQHIDRRELRYRATRHSTCEPRPFLRWAGSKRAHLHEFLDILPETIGHFYEPFLGAGSLFFLLSPKRAVLSDTCAELIATFRAVRDNVSAVLRYLRPLRPRKAQYYRVRSTRSSGRFKRAAEFVYMNKVCWNGLYRVNSNGEFNVPYGRPKSDVIIDSANLRACSGALRRRGVSLVTCDFEEATTDALPGDLVYFDPPYVTRHNNNGFVDYNETLFSWNDQVRLARHARALAQRNVKVVVTNANHREIVELYDGFLMKVFRRSSTLAGNSAFRGTVSEIILHTNCIG